MLDLAWAAGFLEGEGSFSAKSETSGRVSATQKDPECLYRLQRLFSGSVTHRVRMTPVGLSDVHDWTCFGPRAMGVMLTLYAFLSRRRKDQVRLVITQICTRHAKWDAERRAIDQAS